MANYEPGGKAINWPGTGPWEEEEAKGGWRCVWGLDGLWKNAASVGPRGENGRVGVYE